MLALLTSQCHPWVTSDTPSLVDGKWQSYWQEGKGGRLLRLVTTITFPGVSWKDLNTLIYPILIAIQSATEWPNNAQSQQVTPAIADVFDLQGATNTQQLWRQACGTLSRRNPDITYGLLNNSWRDTFSGEHEHGAQWLLVCGAIEEHLLSHIFIKCVTIPCPARLAYNDHVCYLTGCSY